MVYQLLGFFSDGDPGSGGYVFVLCQAYLGVEEVMASGYFAVGGFVAAVELVDDVHNLYAQIVGGFAVAEASLFSFFFHEDVYAFRQAYQAEHGGEAVSCYKAFFYQEMVFKEAALFYLEADAGIHVPCHNVKDVGKLMLFEVLDVFGALGDVAQDEAAEGVGASA